MTETDHGASVPGDRAPRPLDGAQLRRGSLLLVGSRAASAAVVLLLTPYVVSRLGTEEYGIWVLVAATTGLFGLFDVGAASAIGRLVAHARARGDRGAITGAVTTGLGLRGAQALLVASGAWFLAPVVAAHLAVSAGLESDATQALRVAVVMGVVATLAGAVNGVLIGF